MELWHWHAQTKVNLAVTAYWYARPGGKDEFAAVRAEDLVIRPMPAYAPVKVAGAIEGEGMKKVKVTGTAEPQDWANLSGERHLWWHAGMRPGDTLTLGFPVSERGTYRVVGRFLSARDYGIHQVAINGRNAGKPIDFYNPEVKPTEEMELGVFELSAGENQLSTTIIGANEKAVKSYMFGLDYILLKPAE
jgi:hypothetical protein